MRKKSRRTVRKRKNQGDSLFLTSATQAILMFSVAVLFFISAFIFDNQELKEALKTMIRNEDYVTQTAEVLKKGEGAASLFNSDIVLGEAIFTKNGVTPVEGYVTSLFGERVNPVLGKNEFHYGVDIAAAKGEKVVAPFPAVCEKVGVSPIDGNYVILNHGDFKTKYCHLSSTPVKENLRFRQGETVGFVGDSGLTTGPHLHFEIIKDEKYINPESAFKKI